MLYKDAGVNIDKADKFVEYIKGLNENIGGFGGLFPIPSGYKNPILVASTDSVGTKLKIAYQIGEHNTIGKDIVNHCINDILCCGAKPLFFMDYIGTGKLDVKIGKDILRGIKEACDENDTILLGGETAEMPGFYTGSEYDLVGFIVGIVEKDGIIDGSEIKLGDKLIGLESNGVHTNGYSLIRKILKNKKINLDFYINEANKTVGEELLRVHKSYKDIVFRVLKFVKGIAHITGGGFYGNIPRILPDGLGVMIDKNCWQVPPIFKFIQDQGNVFEKEMFKVFNMGIGMVLVVDADSIENVSSEIKERVHIIGEVVKGKGIKWGQL